MYNPFFPLTDLSAEIIIEWKTFRRKEHSMHLLICYSSLTGNTKKIAFHLAEQLRAEGHTIQLLNTHSALRELHGSEGRELPCADLILLCFWCRRSSMDSDSLKLLAEYQGQTIAAVGTMGGDSSGDYGVRVRSNVTAAIEEHNRCAGVFTCVGKIQESRTEARRALPKDSPHYLDDEHYARHLATRSHPDENDLENAFRFVHTFFQDL